MRLSPLFAVCHRSKGFFLQPIVRGAGGLFLCWPCLSLAPRGPTALPKLPPPKCESAWNAGVCVIFDDARSSGYVGISTLTPSLAR